MSDCLTGWVTDQLAVWQTDWRTNTALVQLNLTNPLFHWLLHYPCLVNRCSIRRVLISVLSWTVLSRFCTFHRLCLLAYSDSVLTLKTMNPFRHFCRIPLTGDRSMSRLPIPTQDSTTQHKKKNRDVKGVAMKLPESRDCSCTLYLQITEGITSEALPSADMHFSPTMVSLLEAFLDVWIILKSWSL
jgi:hypothetical protein